MVMEKLKGGTFFVLLLLFSFFLSLATATSLFEIKRWEMFCSLVLLFSFFLLTTAAVCLFPAMLSFCSPVGNLGLERRLRE